MLFPKWGGTGDFPGKKRIIINISVILVSCAFLFVYFQFFSHVKPGIQYDDIRKQYINIRGNTYIDDWELEIKNYYFQGESSLPFWYGIQYSGRYSVFEFLALIPFGIELAFYWRTIFFNTKHKMKKVAYLVAPLGIISVLPCFVMHADYGRWFYSVYFYELAAIWLVNLIHDEGVVIANTEMKKRLTENVIYYLALFMFWISLGSLNQLKSRIEWGYIYDALKKGLNFVINLL